jgi:hypothetical protein
MIYSASNWYWTPPPGQNAGFVYSSAVGALVATTNATYVAWLAEGNSPQLCPLNTSGVRDWADLDDVLTAAGLPPTGLTPPTSAMLNAHANAKQWALATGGYTITVNSVPLFFPTDIVSMALITGKAARLAQPNPPASFAWQMPAGFVTIASADFILVATQIADFVQSTFNTLQVVFAAIAAGTITTTAEIDAAAWPSNVSTTPA